MCFSETGDVSRDDLGRARFFNEFSLKVGRAFAGNVLTRNKYIFLLFKNLQKENEMKSKCLFTEVAFSVEL